MSEPHTIPHVSYILALAPNIMAVPDKHDKCLVLYVTMNISVTIDDIRANDDTVDEFHL